MRPRSHGSVDLGVRIGDVALPNPVLCASGSAGYGAEFARVMDVTAPGAVVVKSQSAEPCPGNPLPRVTFTPGGMINSIGLQGRGVAAWATDDLPGLRDAGARVVASIWGRRIDEYRRAAELLAPYRDHLLAVEVNVSCPNIDNGNHLFAADPKQTAAAVKAAAAAELPRWAKLSLVARDIVAVARAAQEAGADAVTLINTVPGMVIDINRRRPVLGAGGGGVSGPAIRPLAVKAVWDVHAALPDLPILGVGGVRTGADAVEMLMAGASAVQVGMATLAAPDAAVRICRELARWCRQQGVTDISSLTGVAHPSRRDLAALAPTTARLRGPPFVAWKRDAHSVPEPAGEPAAHRRPAAAQRHDGHSVPEPAGEPAAHRRPAAAQRHDGHSVPEPAGEPMLDLPLAAAAPVEQVPS